MSSSPGRTPGTEFVAVMQFENDVYIATSEPHGNIEAVITRADALPHAKL